MPSVHSSPVRPVQATSTPSPPPASSPGGIPRWVWVALGGGIILGGAVLYVFWGGGGSGAGRKEGRRPKEATTAASAKVAANSGPVKVEDVPEDEEDLPTDPLQLSIARKNKGNKYFKGGRYELAVKCYTEAIQGCPEGSAHDLATFHQNRAAAYEQLENFECVLSDCTRALELNPKYVKALDRRAKVLRRQAEKMASAVSAGQVDEDGVVGKLTLALEDVTAGCILEGFQRQDHLMLVDAVLKELGRAEAKLAVKTREHILTSKHFIQQYFMSFDEDPIMKDLEKEGDSGEVEDAGANDAGAAAAAAAASSGPANGRVPSLESGDHQLQAQKSCSGFRKAKLCLKNEEYGDIIGACTEEIEFNGEFVREAKVLRGTFYILSKQQSSAFADLESVASDESAPPKLRVNALIKRASLYIQRCQDPNKDPQMAFADFTRAIEIDMDNADIYHHRGQVHLLTDQIAEATSDFARAVELNPTFPIAYVQKLYTDYRAASQTQDREAVNNVINLFERAIEKFPKCVETYALFAQVLSDQGKFERADDLYRRAQEVDPSNANLHVHRALIALQWKGDVTGAVDLIKEGLGLDEKCEFAYETLGTIEVQRGNLDEAVSLFNKAIPLANTELEMAHLFGLRDAAMAQKEVTRRLGVTLPVAPMMGGMM